MKAASAGAVITLAALALLGCSDREQDGQPSEATPTATSAATSTPTATPLPGRELAEGLAASPAYFIYVVGPGDTIAAVADMFDGIPGSADGAYEQELRDVNALGSSDSLPIGYELGIPLRLPAANSLFQSNTIAEALGGQAELLVPSEGLQGAFLGRLVFHRVELANGDVAGEGHGYLITYALADRVAVKAGELDREARVTGEAFVVAGGSLVSRLNPSQPDTYVWRDAERDLFGVRVLDPAAGEASGLSGGLVTAE